MEKALYLECSSGISGDMTVAALLDLGADKRVLLSVLDSVPACGYSVEIGRVKKSGIDCCDFVVKLDRVHENFDHDINYLHGNSLDFHEHYTHKETYHEGHDRCTQEHHHGRGLAEIYQILDQTAMTEAARNLAKKIFQILAESESKAHAIPVDDVHFHEVGAIDSIVDIVAVAVCLDNLGISRVFVPKLSEGCGTVRCQHGVLPVPVPAVTNIAAAYHLNLEITDTKGELVTPTGAAIVAAIKTDDRLPARFQIEKTGIGAGKRNYERPSMLRAMIIEIEKDMSDVIVKLESNIDDSTGEQLGYVMEKLFEEGARDVHYHPVYMKKNRPAWQLNVICKKEDVARLEDIIFRETTTIGIRRVEMERTILKRQQQEIDTEYGKAAVKICEVDGTQRVYPEYESVARICREKDLPYGEVYEKISCTAVSRCK
jgi:hypothetical protein